MTNNRIGQVSAAIAGWGRYPIAHGRILRPERYAELAVAEETRIARGLGRSYGDAALNDGRLLVVTERVNRLLDFDAQTGILTAEAGTNLSEVLDCVIGKGWFLPVTPGTQHVTLGGCVAADVHGKNHHRVGSFGSHVTEIELILADGRRVRCGPAKESEVFWATVGGMGLTGVIGEVTLKLNAIESAYLVVQHAPAANLEAAFRLLEGNGFDDEFTVAWIDCVAGAEALGRSVVMRAHHALLNELPATQRGRPFAVPPRRARAVPFDFPRWVLNRTTVGLFNELYYHYQGRQNAPMLRPYDRYFYPLDAIAHWNRMYGRRGFIQYQCVLPETRAFDGITELLQQIAASKRASFLAVLKRLGKRSPGLLSFPMAGYTLALDFPIGDDALFGLLDSLDQTVLRYGGRVYLAKDARLKPEAFRAMYSGYPDWLRVKQILDPDNRFSSNLSRRLGITPNA